jgi:hypothetical protein
VHNELKIDAQNLHFTVSGAFESMIEEALAWIFRDNIVRIIEENVNKLIDSNMDTLLNGMFKANDGYLTIIPNEYFKKITFDVAMNGPPQVTP